MEETIALAYFFFDFSALNKQTYKNALRSIIIQLSSQSSRAWQILIDLTEYFEPNGLRLGTIWTVSVNFLQMILEKYLLAYDKIYFVFDALDEFVDQEIALEFIVNLLARSHERANILKKHWKISLLKLWL